MALQTALVINPGSEKGLILLRKLVHSGYSVTALTPDTPSAIDTLEHLQFTNPELNDIVNVVAFPQDVIDDPGKIIESANLTAFPVADFIFSFNPTENVFVKWDLNLIYALSKTNVVQKNKTLVVVGRDAENVPETENKSLQTTMTKMFKLFRDENITFVDLTEVGSLPGDEEYVVETYMHEVIRKSFKVDSCNSLENIYKYIVYHYVPGFLLNLVIYFQTLFCNIVGLSGKEKSD